jgi:formimidoylglutamate deiminase
MTVLAPDWLWTPDGLRTGWAVEIGPTGHIVQLLAPDRHPRDAERLPGRLLLPAMVNAHSHAFQRAFRGQVQWRAAGDDTFWTWRDRMYAVANGLDPEGVEAVSRLAFVEMAEAGFGAVGEFHYVHHQPDGTRYADPDELARRVIAAADAVGIRICLLRVVYARGGPGVPLRPDQRRFGDRSPDEALGAVARLATAGPVGLAPHSVRAVPPDWFPALAAWRGVVHAHVSEQPAENAACQQESGRSPLQLLAGHGLVTERFSAVHLTFPLDGDLDALVAADAGVVVCPSTELDLGDGFLPVAVRERARMSVGTDSQARIDPWAEVRDLELHARGVAGRRNVLAPPGEPHGLATRLLRAGTANGARALGLDDRGIAPGAPADLVALDLRRPAATGVPPLEAAAFVATPEWVDALWVGGRRIVAAGRHAARDAIAAAAAPYLTPRRGDPASTSG